MKIAKLTYLILSVALLASLSTTSAVGQAKQSYLFYGGVERMVLGDTTTAKKLFTEVLTVNPTHLPTFYYLSRIEAMGGNFEKALQFIDYATKYDSENLDFLEHKLQLLLQTRDYQRAIVLQKEMLELDPNNKDLYYMGVGLMYEIQNFESVISMCNEFERRFGMESRIIDYHRSAFIASRNYQKALEYMQEVLQNFPDDVNYNIIMAELSAALGSNVSAEHYFDRAIEIMPTAYQTYMAKATFYSHSNNTLQYITTLTEAFRHSDISPELMVSTFKDNFMTPEPYQLYYVKVIDLASAMTARYPDNLAVQLQYGQFLTYTGQIDLALEHYTSLYENYPTQSEPMQRLMEIQFYQKDYDKAQVIATNGYEQFGESRFLESKVAAYWLSAQTNEALRLVKQGLKEFKSDSLQSLYYALQGDIYHEIGKDSKAFSSYDKSLKYNPQNAVVLNNYAYYLSLLGKNLEFALEMSERSNEISPDNATYLDTQAWILFNLGKYVDAQLLMGRVMVLDANPSAEVLMHYGDILYALGDDFLARSYWKRAAEAGASDKEIELRALRPKAVRPPIE